MMLFPPLQKGSHPHYDLLGWGEPRSTFPVWMWIGLTIIILSEILLFLKIEPVYSHFTLIVWWGYIFLIDGLIKKRRGLSFLADRPGFFLFLMSLSLFWWLVFEFYNCYLENWVYIGVPENIIHRYVCYALSFATITPAILLTFELSLTLWPPRMNLDFQNKPSQKTQIVWLIIGIICVTFPLFLPREVRHYLFGFVWVGFVFLIEPLAYWSGSYSMLRLWSAGGRMLVWNMFGAGAVCGLLWEFWNYWAGAKWLYTVPFTPTIRYFEMPLLGFLGFLPFAWECLVLTVLTSLIIGGIIKISPHCSMPSKNDSIKSWICLIYLFAVFFLAYTINDQRYFPITGFKLSSPEIQTETPQFDKALNTLSLDRPLHEQVKNIQPLWTPNNATRENLIKFDNFQTDPQSWRTADYFIREYAVHARFNWANLRNVNPVDE